MNKHTATLVIDGEEVATATRSSKTRVYAVAIFGRAWNKGQWMSGTTGRRRTHTFIPCTAEGLSDEWRCLGWSKSRDSAMGRNYPSYGDIRIINAVVETTSPKEPRPFKMLAFAAISDNEDGYTQKAIDADNARRVKNGRGVSTHHRQPEGDARRLHRANNCRVKSYKTQSDAVAAGFAMLREGKADAFEAWGDDVGSAFSRVYRGHRANYHADLYTGRGSHTFLKDECSDIPSDAWVGVKANGYGGQPTYDQDGNYTHQDSK